MKKLRILVIGIVLTAAVCACGVPEMTPEQEERIVNYAANIALKYDSNYDNRLVDLSKYDIPIPELPSEEMEESGMDPVEDTDTVDVSGGTGPNSSIDEFYGLTDLDIEFTGHHTCKTYPDDAEDDFFFSLEAKKGKTLLVLEFNVTNKGTASKDVNMILLDPVLRIQLNGEKTVGVMQTMLLDDLTSFVGTLEAGESVALVILTEIDENYEGKITHIALNMRKSTGEESQKLILLQ